MTEGFSEQLPSGLRVVRAGNPGPMTGTGTNSFLVGEERVAIIDPGPDDPAHLANLLSALRPGAKVSHIIVTHAHRDHSALAARLSAEVDAPVLAFEAADATSVLASLEIDPAELMGGEGIDEAFRRDGRLADGETLQSPDWALDVVHTPGHLNDHICLRWQGAGIVFTGDHVMGWASTFVSPPEGNMTDYMASLDALDTLPEKRYLPAHGAEVPAGAERVAELRAHRRMREDALLAELHAGAKSVMELTEKVYEDTHKALHAAAARNVLAHLLDLLARGVVASRRRPGQERVFYLQ
ncbi:MAG: MBL fold metallo-hydrolase [Pseudomonadota bacterium]